MLQIKLTLQCSHIPIDLLTPPPNLSQGRQTFSFPQTGTQMEWQSHYSFAVLRSQNHLIDIAVQSRSSKAEISCVSPRALLFHLCFGRHK